MLQIWPLRGIPEVTAQSDLVALIADAAGDTLADGDILVVTSKIVSKAEGRMIAADDREDAITAETVRVVASRTSESGHTTRIVENKLGSSPPPPVWMRPTPRRAPSCSCRSTPMHRRGRSPPGCAPVSACGWA